MPDTDDCSIRGFVFGRRSSTSRKRLRRSRRVVWHPHCEWRKIRLQSYDRRTSYPTIRDAAKGLLSGLRRGSDQRSRAVHSRKAHRSDTRGCSCHWIERRWPCFDNSTGCVIFTGGICTGRRPSQKAQNNRAAGVLDAPMNWQMFGDLRAGTFLDRADCFYESKMEIHNGFW
jgi:hypothetical protein